MRHWPLLVLITIISASITAGCVTTGVESVVYEDSAFVFQIRDTEIPDNLMVLIIINRIDGLHQEEEETIYIPLEYAPGEDSIIIDTPLPDGSYKAHLIFFQDGKRLNGHIINFKVDGEDQR